ncbi:MAG: radical SAM protein [Thermoplasmatota archaeon]
MSRGAYEVVKRIYFKIKKRQLWLFAHLFGYRFRCRSLTGESDHGLTINSDLTLTCNCSDYKGEGQLGSLKTQPFMEILRGVKANAFRESLGRGRLPIDRCIGCADLEKLKKGALENQIVAPKRILVENISGCNLRCTQCNRRDVREHRKQVQMSLEDMEIVAKTVKELGILRVNYYNLGEPFLSPNILEELTILKKENPDIELFTSTNGLLLRGEKKVRAALLFDHIYFTLPGGDQESVEKYQKGQDFAQTIRNISGLISGEFDRSNTIRQKRNRMSDIRIKKTQL